jgi:hypothetical protein
MMEMTMLDLDAIDLDELCMALEDHSYETSWWFDPRSGEVRFHSPHVDDDTVEDLDDAGLIAIGPTGSSESYGDMEDFIDAVPDWRARDRLALAIADSEPAADATVAVQDAEAVVAAVATWMAGRTA